MVYVKKSDVMQKFLKYLKDHDHEMISKDEAVSDLQDALDSADSIERDD